MIFDLSLSSSELEEIDSARLYNAIAELLRAHRLGHHLLVVNRSVSRWLLANLSLPAADAAILTKVASEFAQTGGVREAASVYVSICAIPSPSRRRGNAIEVTIDDMSDPYIFDRTALIVENSSNDGMIYDIIIEAVGRHLGVAHLNFERVHGGGESMVAVLGEKIADRRVIALVADSDRQMPTQPHGRKVGKFSKIASDANWPLASIVETPGREVENLVPFDVIRSLDCAAQRGAEVDVLFKIAQEELRLGVPPSERLLAFIDLKEGVDLAKLSAPQRHEELAWLAGKFDLLHVGPNIRGFGHNILSSLLKDGGAIRLLREGIRERGWLEHFGGSFVDVVWFGAASRRIYV
jgi:hypothetical protein